MTEDLKAVLHRAFSMFEEDGYIDTDKVAVILKTLGHLFDKHELSKAIKAEDEDDSEQLDFEQFCRVICIFIHDVDEEVDDEVLQQELKEAFRLYDKQGKILVEIFQRDTVCSIKWGLTMISWWS